MNLSTSHFARTAADSPLMVSRRSLLSFIVLAVGCILNGLAYKSLQPLGAFILFFALGQFLLMTTPFGGTPERTIYLTTFAVGWFMAGIAAIYANSLNDPFQNGSDAASFFDLATSISSSSSLAYISKRSEGAASVLLWKWVYDFFAMLGFAKGRFIGILVNSLAVALTGVVAVKIARLTYGNDMPRLTRLTRMFAACGLFWLFASLHIRDAVVLLAVTILLYLWVRYLKRASVGNLLLVGSGTLIGFGVFGLLRAEFVFVPAAMLVAGLAAILLYDDSKGLRKAVVYLVSLLGITAALVLFVVFGDRLLLALQVGQDFYGRSIQAADDDGGSLGARLLSAPLPLKLVLGSAYLFIFPIPAWSGFQLESAYHLFKSFNVIFFYALIPLFMLATLDTMWNRSRRTPVTMFLLFVVIGFTLAVAGTSVETRHFGAFLVPLMIFSLQPDLSEARTKRRYRMLLLLVLGLMFLIHAAWAVLKAGS